MITVNDLKGKIEYEDYIQALNDDLIVWSKELVDASSQININVLINNYIINRLTITNQMIKLAI